MNKYTKFLYIHTSPALRRLWAAMFLVGLFQIGWVKLDWRSHLDANVRSQIEVGISFSLILSFGVILAGQLQNTNKPTK